VEQRDHAASVGHLAADDPDAVAVKTAAIAAAMLEGTADDLLEQWATILWPSSGRPTAQWWAGCTASELGTRALSGGRSSREGAERL
jgi:hypothetical protein